MDVGAGQPARRFLHGPRRFFTMAVRKSGPWYRTSRRMWFANIGGRQHALGVTDPDDKAGAKAAYQQLLANLREELESSPPAEVGPALAPVPPTPDFAPIAEAIAQQVLALMPAAPLLPPVPIATSNASDASPFIALQNAARACGPMIGATVGRVVLLDANCRNLMELHVPELDPSKI